MDIEGRNQQKSKLMMVYLLENAINGKAYVGQHRGFDLNKRWTAALTHCEWNPHLHASIRKYGAEAFQRKILAYASCQQELDLLERFFISALQTTNRQFGYNMQLGGRVWHGGHTQEVRNKIGETQRRSWERKSQEEKMRRAEMTRRVWESKSPDEKARHANRAQLTWWTKSATEMAEISRKVSASLHLMWESRKASGFKVKPHTEERKRRISEGVRQYWARRHKAMMKKPVSGTKVQNRQEHPLNARETRAMVALKEVKQAKRQLSEIKGRLAALEFELLGGCNW